MFIQNDCWELIKTFAGIYSISTDWDKLINGLSLGEINSLYTQHGKTCSMLLSYKNLQAKKQYLVMKCLTDFDSKTVWIQMNDLLQKNLLLKKSAFFCKCLLKNNRYCRNHVRSVHYFPKKKTIQYYCDQHSDIRNRYIFGKTIRQYEEWQTSRLIAPASFKIKNK
jgi:hypothetical protein